MSKIRNHIVLILLICGLQIKAQHSPRKEAGVLTHIIKELHYAPLALQDSMCEKIALRLISEIDPQKIFFAEEDFNEIKNKSHILSSDLTGKSWVFVPYLTAILKSRIELARLNFENYLAITSDLKNGDTIFISSKTTFVNKISDLKKRHGHYCKNKVLYMLAYLPDSILNNPSLLKEWEVQSRNKIKKRELRKLQNILDFDGGVERYLMNNLFNSYTLSLDAHSVYLPREMFNQFRQELEDNAYSFGIEIEENEEGEIAIQRILPGGNAWKTNELFKGDILVSVQSPGNVEESLEELDEFEVDRILNKYNEIVLTVREQSSGRLKKVPLKKERIRNEDDKVKGLVLNGEKKIGYISLPGFYSEWENSSVNGCSNDVAKAILYLKQEGIEGLILDIRFNGGGSLQEGLSMAGIFINEGPLYLTKERDQKIQVMKDPNRGVAYDGPLVVMVNGQSASASEVLAAVLQDYNRAILVGSRTYGKATGQKILPVDTTLQGMLSLMQSKDVQHGYMLLTTQKLFRITGKTAQRNGVQPDINLPDYMDGFQTREEELPTALPAEEVVKKVYYTPLTPLPIEELRKKSQQRQENSPLASIPKTMQDYWNHPDKKVLNLQYYRNMSKETLLLWDNLEKCIESSDTVYTCLPTADMQKVLDLDEYEKNNFTYLSTNLTKDTYLKESYKIILDLINLTK